MRAALRLFEIAPLLSRRASCIRNCRPMSLGGGVTNFIGYPLLRHFFPKTLGSFTDIFFYVGIPDNVGISYAFPLAKISPEVARRGRYT